MSLQKRGTVRESCKKRKKPETLTFLAFRRSRSDVIRTRDLCVPNAALYQTEPRFAVRQQKILYIKSKILSTFFEKNFNFFQTLLSNLVLSWKEQHIF